MDNGQFLKVAGKLDLERQLIFSAPFSNIGGGLAVFQPYPPIALGGDMSSNIGAGYMGPFGSSAPMPSFPPNAASPPVNTYPGKSI